MRRARTTPSRAADSPYMPPTATYIWIPDAALWAFGARRIVRGTRGLSIRLISRGIY